MLLYFMEKNSLKNKNDGRDEHSVDRHVTIKSKHQKWCDRNFVQLSKFLQWAIDQQMEYDQRDVEGGSHVS